MVNKNMKKHQIIVKTIAMKRQISPPIAVEPYIDIGKPLYYLVLEMPESKKTLDINISKEEYIKLIKFITEIELEKTQRRA